MLHQYQNSFRPFNSANEGSRMYHRGIELTTLTTMHTPTAIKVVLLCTCLAADILLKDVLVSLFTSQRYSNTMVGGKPLRMRRASAATIWAIFL